MQDGKTDLTLLKSKKYSFKQCRGDEHKKSRNSKFLKKMSTGISLIQKRRREE